MIDGAGRWKRMWHITLPGIKGTIVTLLIMTLGRVMGSNLERLKVFDNTMVRDFQYQLAVYIYEKGLTASQFSKATAVGLFQSAVGLALVLITDRIAKSLGEEGLM
jgi:putative aldouronate transport system permease protein